ncbi:MAG: ParB N-terminal domain-containing protein [Thermoguttaceae bacterium]
MNENFTIEIRDIDTIIPYENNPRINEKAVDPVAKSIKEFGFRQPIVVDTDGIIIAGHTRFLAAKKLGLAKVPVHVATELSPEQVKAFRIADNKTGEIAEWNLEILPIEIASLQASGFNMDSLGFTEKSLLQLLATDLTQGNTDPDSVPEPPDAAITQRGDLWLLGEHRLMCGDSAKKEDVDRLLDGNIVHLCQTDPPYNVCLM